MSAPQIANSPGHAKQRRNFPHPWSPKAASRSTARRRPGRARI